MCGIAGIIQSGGPSYQEHHIQKMVRSLAHRGPDGEDTWRNDSGSVWLGHRRLSIIDLSDAGRQPMHYLNRYTIIHNGEVYNYPELRETLEQKGYQFRSGTDTEVMVAAFDCWKENCVEQFDGMFAFAIWDEKEKQLFAARDRFGEKPFFYCFTGKHLLFASEMKALWAAGIERAFNRKMLFNFITIGYTDNPEQTDETFYENIRKLPSATWMKLDTVKNELTLEQYWDIDTEYQLKQLSVDDARQQFMELFTLAVKRRQRSDVLTGTCLSGGLDSSSIAALASPMMAFTAIFPGFEKDESVFAKTVAEKFQLPQQTVSLSATDFFSDWEKLCYHQEEPFGSASIYAQYKVYALAAKHGVKSLLDGQGADEILAGYHKYYKWFWQELYRKGKLRQSGELNAAKERGIRESFTYKNKIAAYFPSFATVVMERQYLLHAIRHEDLTKEFVQQQSKEAYYTTPEYFTLNGVLYFNTRIHGLEELLRYADRNSMAHGCEVRLPFLSHELVEFVFSLPAELKIHNGWTKWLLRQSMNEILPPDITWRPGKIGFEPPQKLWMQEKEWQERTMQARKKMVEEKILKPDVLNKAVIPLGSHEAGNYDWRYLSIAPFL